MQDRGSVTHAKCFHLPRKVLWSHRGLDKSIRSWAITTFSLFRNLSWFFRLVLRTVSSGEECKQRSLSASCFDLRETRICFGASDFCRWRKGWLCYFPISTEQPQGQREIITSKRQSRFFEKINARSMTIERETKTYKNRRSTKNINIKCGINNRIECLERELRTWKKEREREKRKQWESQRGLEKTATYRVTVGNRITTKARYPYPDCGQSIRKSATQIARGVAK